MAEVWKTVQPREDYAHKYVVSTAGRVGRIKKNGKAKVLELTESLDGRPCAILERSDAYVAEWGDTTAVAVVADLMARAWSSEPKPKAVPKSFTTGKPAPHKSFAPSDDSAQPRTRAVLTEDIVRAIRKACAAGKSQASQARKYGVTTMSVSLIVRRVNWKHVE